MKKITLLFALLISVCTLNAQKGFHVGLQGSYFATGINSVPTAFTNTSDLTVADKSSNLFLERGSYVTKYGYSFGLAVGYGFISSVGLQLEINKAQMGSKYNLSTSPTTVREIDLTYTQLPILLKFRPGDDEAMVHSYFLIGPQFQFLSSAQEISAREKSTNNFEVIPAYDAKAKGHYSTNDLGIAFGMGADIMIPPGIYFNAGVRIYYGTSDINADAYRNISTTKKPAYAPAGNINAGLGFGAHYKF